MTPTNPRTRLLWTGVALVWLLALWLPVLMLVHTASPGLAVRLAIGAAQWLTWLGITVLAVLVSGYLLLPTVPAGLRLGYRRILAALSADRAPLRRALTELQHLETAARNLEVGRLAALQGDTAIAIPHLRRALEMEPEHTAARYQLALMLYLAARLPEARTELQQVLQQDRGHSFGEALALLGWVQHLLGDDQQSARLLRQHQQEQGGNRKSHFWLAQVLAATGDRSGAMAALLFAASPPQKQRLTAEENWYRARARVQLWRYRGQA